MIDITNPSQHRKKLEKSFMKHLYPKYSEISCLILNLLLASFLLRNLLSRKASFRVIFFDITNSRADDELLKEFGRDATDIYCQLHNLTSEKHVVTRKLNELSAHLAKAAHLVQELQTWEEDSPNLPPG